MIQLLFIRVGVCIRLANTFGDNLGIAFLVAGILAVLALHSSRIFEEVPTKRATHDVIELLKDKFMTVKLMYLFLSLTDSAFAIQPDIKRSLVLDLFC